jgi:hypothetical protein
MKVSTQIKINSTREKVWQVITDIENSVNVISGIIKIEILNPPGDNLVGLKWKETRVMFGKEADEVMWVTHSKMYDHYQTRAESHGAIYRTRLSITEEEDGVTLKMSFDGQGASLMAKIMSGIFGGLMKKSMTKALVEDLKDIKKAVEAL